MNQRKIEIAPSILSADFRVLEQEVVAAQKGGADRIHCDVMDGHFVPNLSFGPMVIAAVKKCVTIPLDVHLMISNPAQYIESYCSAGADTLIVHAETCTDLSGVLKDIKNRGKRTGVTVNPDIGIDLFLPQLAFIDQVLIMTVHAGFGAQKFIADMLDKIDAVFSYARAKGFFIDIEVDGGINDITALQCAQKGANVFVAGNYVFNSDDYHCRIESIRKAAVEGARRDIK